jgi:hypothetical protein
MKWKDLLPSRLKWLTYIPLIMIDKVLDYVKQEDRKWVLILLFVLGLTYSLKDAINAKFTVDPIPTQVQKSTIVNAKLNDLIESSGASRAYIFQFHNGITFYTGQHAQRFSCTYETVREGVSREAANLQDLQVSIFSWWINEVLSGKMTYYNIENIKDYTTKISLQQQGVKSVICRPLIYKNRVVGIVGLDYVRDENPIVNDSSFMRSFEYKSVNLARLVSE